MHIVWCGRSCDGTAIVSWLGVNAGRASVMLRRIAIGGQGPKAAVGDTSADRDAGFPRLARDGSAFVVLWTESNTPKRLRAIRIDSTQVPGLQAR